MTTMTMTDIAIGPWFRNMLRIQPITGISESCAGGRNWVNAPAPFGDDFEMRLLR